MFVSDLPAAPIGPVQFEDGGPFVRQGLWVMLPLAGMAVDGRGALVTAEWWETRGTTAVTRLLQATLPISPSSA